MDTAIHRVKFNNTYEYFIHSHYLKKFEYFSTFLDDIEQNLDHIPVFLHDMPDSINIKKCIQLLFNVAYNIAIDPNICNTEECAMIYNIASFLQYKNLTGIIDIICKMYDPIESFDIIKTNRHINILPSKLVINMATKCIENKFKTQLFNFDYMNLTIYVRHNQSFVIDRIFFEPPIDSINKNTTSADISQWILFALNNFLKLFKLHFSKCDFSFYIKDNNLHVSDIVIDDIHRYELSHSHTYVDENKKEIGLSYRFNLNTFVKNIIFASLKQHLPTII